MNNFHLSLELNALAQQFNLAINDHFNVLQSEIKNAVDRICTPEHISQLVNNKVAHELDNIITREVCKLTRKINIGDYIELNRKYYDYITFETDGMFWVWDETKEEFIDRCNSLAEAIQSAKKYYN